MWLFVQEEPNNQYSVLNDNFLGYLETLQINLEGECSNENVLPALGDNENC